MGAENSSLNVSISEKQLVEKLPYDVMLYDGKLNQTNQRISIFEYVGSSQNPFTNYTLDLPITRTIRNLKIYRHPYSILKFLASTSDKLLVTELVRGSLSKVLKSQNEIQICLGVKNLLNALIFLVETAGVRHLNISLDTVFVTDSGHWKLNGMEHVFQSSDITKEFLQKSRPYRNPQFLDPDEDDGTGLEQFAFASICEAVISKNSTIPHSQEFLTYCRTHLKHNNPSMRPLLSGIVLHNYFNHDFIVIHSFLSELPLKTQQAKQDFFKTLSDKLKKFDENTIGSQLSDLLMSRLVLLEQSAQYHLLPVLLKPQTILEDDEETSTDEFIFTMPAFRQHMVPKIKQVFCVLDVQIRLILLENFPLYVNTFTKEELVDEILPQLLLGIKDTNDLLVTKTLLCLADLVSILGANLVIGKNRTKIFADGRPQQTNDVWTSDQPRSITPVMCSSSLDILSSSPVDHVDVSDHSSKEAVTVINQNGVSNRDEDLTDHEIESEWNWEQEAIESETNLDADDGGIYVEMLPLEIQEEKLQVSTYALKDKPAVTRPKIDDNIDDLDIKNKKLTKLEEQTEDFFSDFDMTPTFQKPTLSLGTLVENQEDITKPETSSSRLQMSLVTSGEDNNCWGEDWNDEL